MGLLPEEAGGEAVDGGVGEAIRGNDAVPVLVLVDSASAGHVALAGEYEDLFGGGMGFSHLG